MQTKKQYNLYHREYFKKWIKKNLEKFREYRRKANKKYREKCPEKVNKNTAESVRKWRLKFPKKNRAHRIVFIELRSKRLEKHPCFCGEEKVQAHHENYNKPLCIIWLCKQHHTEADMKKKNRK